MDISIFLEPVKVSEKVISHVAFTLKAITDKRPSKHSTSTMSTTTCLHLEELAGLQPPKLSQSVHREECTQCFDNQVRPGGPAMLL